MVTLLLATLLAASEAPPPSDFLSGMEAYERKDYATARAVFLDLAELGHGQSLFNLGAMALRGEGGARDRGSAFGYLTSAAEAGYDTAKAQLEALRPGLTPEELGRAEEVVRRFGRRALAATVLPEPPSKQEGVVAPRKIGRTAVRYPDKALTAGQQGVVVVRGTIDTDGLTRDARIALALPPVGKGGAPFAEEALRAYREMRFEPARRAGRPITVVYQARFTFQLPEERGPLREDLVEATVAQARGGDPQAQFLAALLASTSPPIGVSASEAESMLLAAAQWGLPEAQCELGRQLQEQGKPAHAGPWLQRAARAGSPDASLALGLRALEGPAPEPALAATHLARGVGAKDPGLLRRAVLELACSPHPALRMPSTAGAMAARLRLDRPTDPLLAELAAAAHAAAGDFESAVRYQRKAVSWMQDVKRDQTAARERLASYAAGVIPCESLRAAWADPGTHLAP